MRIDVSIGEVVDKATILLIKTKKITESTSRNNCLTELDHCIKELNKINITVEHKLFKELLEINIILWEIEDNIRQKEKEKDFGKDFVSIARSVYVINDKRAKLKRDINLQFSSDIIEEKFYSKY